MKFSCPKCNTRYSVAEEKIPADKVLRFTCKKCGNVIRLKRKSTAESTARKPRSKSAADGDDYRGSTRVASLKEINALKHRSSASGPATPFDSGDAEWFVLVSGKQRGPMSLGEVERMLEAKALDKRTYAWRDGMDDWRRLANIPELAKQAEAVGDAAWRVVKPVTAPAAVAKKAKKARGKAATDSSTVAMDARQLQAELRKVQADEAAEDGGRAADPGSTVAMDARQLQAELRKVAATAADDNGAGRRATVEVDDEPSPAGRGGTGLDVGAIAALTGEPAGPGLQRRTTEVHDTELHDDLPLGLAGLGDNDYFDPLGAPDLSAVAASADLGDGPLEPPLPPPQNMTEEQSAAYLQAPPGEATRIFMATAGIFKRRRRNKTAAIVGAITVLVLVAVVMGDVVGLYEIPGMGLVYDVTGITDPNVDRAIHRVETKLHSSNLSTTEQAKLRKKLLGLTKHEHHTKGSAGATAKRHAAAQPTVGVKETHHLSRSEHDLTASIFNDTRKQEQKLSLKPPSEVQAPNLPDGLTQKAIVNVIGQNVRSMSLCVAQSMKKGERLPGKMEVQMTINATGAVTDVQIDTGKQHCETLGACTQRTVRRWRFPRFNGDPVPVSFPIVLSAGF